MSLDEWVATLPKGHRADKELAALRAEVERKIDIEKRAKEWADELSELKELIAENARLREVGGKLAAIVEQEMSYIDVDNLTTQAKYRKYELTVNEYRELRRRATSGT